MNPDANDTRTNAKGSAVFGARTFEPCLTHIGEIMAQMCKPNPAAWAEDRAEMCSNALRIFHAPRQQPSLAIAVGERIVAPFISRFCIHGMYSGHCFNCAQLVKNTRFVLKASQPEMPHLQTKRVTARDRKRYLQIIQDYEEMVRLASYIVVPSENPLIISCPSRSVGEPFQSFAPIPRHSAHLWNFAHIESDKFDFGQDYETIQQTYAAFGAHDPYAEDAQLLTSARLAAKQAMGGTSEETEMLNSIGEFAGVPHLEISTEPILVLPGVSFSVPPPNRFFAPWEKCAHGVWRCRDGNAYGCGVCYPMGSNRSLKNWEDKLLIEQSVDTCELCGVQLKREREHYCPECWRLVIWTMSLANGSFSPEFYTKGKASKFQEKKGKSQKKRAVTWDECLLCLRLILRVRLPNLSAGTWPYLSVPGMHEPLVAEEKELIRFYFNHEKWITKFLTRFWLYTHGSPMAEIEGYEDVQLDGYFRLWIGRIEAALARHGVH